MSRDELDQPFDIHTGGVDLIFPHHENEIAQSTALAIPTMAQIFAHNEHILVDGKKMAKSANNFYTLQDIVNKGFSSLAFRLLILQAHYRSQVHFTWENLEAAQHRLLGYKAMADLRFQLVEAGEEKAPLSNTLTLARGDITNALEDDLNTPRALSILSDTKNQINSQLLAGFDKQAFENFLQFLDDLLGLHLLDSKDITEDQKDLIRQHDKARGDKNWLLANDIRDNQLVKQNIGLRNTAHGTIWYRL